MIFWCYFLLTLMQMAKQLQHYLTNESFKLTPDIKVASLLSKRIGLVMSLSYRVEIISI